MNKNSVRVVTEYLAVIAQKLHLVKIKTCKLKAVNDNMMRKNDFYNLIGEIFNTKHFEKVF